MEKQTLNFQIRKHQSNLAYTGACYYGLLRLEDLWVLREGVGGLNQEMYQLPKYK